MAEPTATLPSLSDADDDVDTASDWEATAQEGDLPSLNGSDDDDDDGETIASQSTDEDERSDDEDDNDDDAEATAGSPKIAEKPAVVKKPAAAKATAKAAAKAAAAAKPAGTKAKSKIKPKLVPPKETKEKPKPKSKLKSKPKPEKSEKPKSSNQPVKIVKYTSTNATGIAGRPLKNAVVIVPSGHSPSEYPSVAAFRENVPTNPEQYLRVNLQGRKPAAYRAFRVKSLQPPYAETCFVLAGKDDDETALKGLGITEQLPELAAAAERQHKNDFPGLLNALQAINPETLRKLGVPSDALEENNARLKTLPAIMSPELAAVLTQPPPPTLKKKRPAAEADADVPTAKRICNQLEACLGGTVTSFTFTMDVRSAHASAPV